MVLQLRHGAMVSVVVEGEAEAAVVVAEAEPALTVERMVR